MKLPIYTLTGFVKVFEINSTDTIYILKEKILNDSDFNPDDNLCHDDSKIICNGKNISIKTTISELNLSSHSKVYFVGTNKTEIDKNIITQPNNFVMQQSQIKNNIKSMYNSLSTLNSSPLISSAIPINVSKDNNLKVSVLSDSPNKFELSVSLPKDNYMANSLTNDHYDSIKTLENNFKILEVNYIKIDSSIKNLESNISNLENSIKLISKKLDYIFEYISSSNNE